MYAWTVIPRLNSGVHGYTSSSRFQLPLSQLMLTNKVCHRTIANDTDPWASQTVIHLEFLFFIVLPKDSNTESIDDDDLKTTGFTTYLVLCTFHRDQPSFACDY